MSTISKQSSMISVECWEVFSVSDGKLEGNISSSITKDLISKVELDDAMTRYEAWGYDSVLVSSVSDFRIRDSSYVRKEIGSVIFSLQYNNLPVIKPYAISVNWTHSYLFVQNFAECIEILLI